MYYNSYQIIISIPNTFYIIHSNEIVNTGLTTNIENFKPVHNNLFLLCFLISRIWKINKAINIIGVVTKVKVPSPPQNQNKIKNSINPRGTDIIIRDINKIFYIKKVLQI